MCPACQKPDDPDGLGVRDTRERVWHGDCARKKLARLRPTMIGCCPGCNDYLGESLTLLDARNRRWHFQPDAVDCVGAALGMID